VAPVTENEKKKEKKRDKGLKHTARIAGMTEDNENPKKFKLSVSCQQQTSEVLHKFYTTCLVQLMTHDTRASEKERELPLADISRGATRRIKRGPKRYSQHKYQQECPAIKIFR